MAATTDYATARTNMVEGQIRPNRVVDGPVVEAFRAVPRERFVPAALKGVAYVDEDIQVGAGRYLMEPMVLSRLLQEARIGAGDTVLDVGCATGYSAAILARLAGTVIALEQDPALAATAGRTLEEVGAGNVVVVTGVLADGHAGRAPYDAIVFQGAVATVPDSLLRQLAEGGRLVAVVLSGRVGKARLYENVGGVVSGRTLFDAAVPPLPGFAPAPRFEF